jgi:predicted GNAT family N-acyltransferase
VKDKPTTDEKSTEAEVAHLAEKLGAKAPRATVRAVKRLLNNDLMSTELSLGFIIPKRQKRGSRLGVQVFIKAYVYSEALLKELPETGGLFQIDREIKRGAKRARKT